MNSEIKCPESGRWQQWLTGHLDSATTEQFTAHVQACVNCQRTLALLTDEPAVNRDAIVRSDAASYESEPQFQKLRATLASHRLELAQPDRSVGLGHEQDGLPGSGPAASTIPPASTRQPSAAPDQSEMDGQPPSFPEIEGLRFERLLGKGGFSRVYLAWDPNLNRNVAIKVLDRHQMDARNLKRFYREARTAAKLDHPSIVQVYRVDQTRAGQPYIMMEYIPGGTLHEKTAGHSAHGISRNDMATAAGLIRDVARGLARVHQRGLVHRDIKPANILIDNRELQDTAKLSDFGLVKFLKNESITLTRAAELVGTPAFMSPEQASELGTVDPASDIYSLGATLYHSITGQPPFAGTSMAVLNQIARAEPIPPRRLNEFVSRDLETVCLKAMAKDPGRRYRCSLDFADDLQRFLDGQPVHAKPLSQVERTLDWCKRNRGLAASLILLITSLVAGTVVSSTMWFRSKANESRAVQSDQQSQRRLAQLENANLILGSIFEDLDMTEIKQENKSLASVLSERLVKAGTEIDSDAVADPIVEAKLRNQLGNSLVSLGFSGEAEPLLERSLEIRQLHLGRQHVDTLQSLHDLGSAFEISGKYDRALPLLRDAFELRKSILGPEHRDTLESMGLFAGMKLKTGELSAGESMLRQVLDLKTKTLGIDCEDTAYAMTQLAAHYVQAGKLEAAKPLYEQAYQTRRQLFGENHYVAIVALNNLAYWAINANRYDEASERLAESLRRLRNKLGDDHQSTIANINNLAYCYMMSTQLDRAIELYREMIDTLERKHGKQHPHTLLGMNNLARALELNNDLNQAIPLFEETLEIRESQLGPDHPDTLVSMNNLGSVYAKADRNEAAVEVFRRALEAKRLKYGDLHHETLRGAANLGKTLLDMGQATEAIPLLREAVAGVEQHKALRGSVGWLMRAYLETNQPELATSTFAESKDFLLDTAESDSMELAEILATIAVALNELESFDEAEGFARQAIRMAQTREPNGWRRCWWQSILGEALMGQHRFDEAQGPLESGLQGLEDNQAELGPDGEELLTAARKRLTHWAQAAGKGDPQQETGKQLDQ